MPARQRSGTLARLKRRPEHSWTARCAGMRPLGQVFMLAAGTEPELRAKKEMQIFVACCPPESPGGLGWLPASGRTGRSGFVRRCRAVGSFSE